MQGNKYHDVSSRYRICMYLLLIASINYVLIRNSLLLTTYQIQLAVASNVYKHPKTSNVSKGLFLRQICDTSVDVIRWASTEVDPASVPFKNKKQEKQRKAGALQFSMPRVGHSLVVGKLIGESLLSFGSSCLGPGWKQGEACQRVGRERTEQGWAE